MNDRTTPITIDDTIISASVDAFNATFETDGHDHFFDETHPYAAYRALEAAFTTLGFTVQAATPFAAPPPCAGHDCVACHQAKKAKPRT